MSQRSVLALNSGSSSVRFSVYGVEGTPSLRLEGKLDRVRLPGTSLSFHNLITAQNHTRLIGPGDGSPVADIILALLQEQGEFGSIVAVGHRVVQGFDQVQPRVVTEELLRELEALIPYDPEHLPQELELIRLIRQRHPGLPQITCFDTLFHRDMPRVARLLAIPRRYESQGLRRYGFHGLSYTFLMERMKQLAGDEAAQGRIILAHLGNGSSMAAVREGKCMETSMGFTPASGLVMGTRSGDIDPGLIPCLVRTGPMTAEQCDHLLNHESGLLGVSGTSSDMRDLLEMEKHDLRAAEAVDLFCHQAKKCVGSFAAVLGGLDTLVFSGGIGEHCPSIRARICAGLEFLSLEIDPAANHATRSVISAAAGRVTVRVIPTDENLMIVRSICQTLGL